MTGEIRRELYKSLPSFGSITLRYEWIVVIVLFMIGGGMANADESQEYRVVIPEEKFIIVEFKQNSLPGIATINSALVEFEPKVVFGWHLSIMIAAQDLDDQKLPTQGEQQELDAFEGELAPIIKANGNALFLSRVTNDGWQELIYRVYDPEPVNEYLQGVISSKNHRRPFDFRIDPDADWEKAQWHIKAVSP